ncbi:hypothetical protein [Methylobacterium soli]|nr:hypothetical protein [Methylobacterium soli]
MSQRKSLVRVILSNFAEQRQMAWRNVSVTPTAIAAWITARTTFVWP